MLAEILQRVDRTTEEAIIEHLEQVDASLAQEVRNRMFVFEDIVELEDRALQQVLMEVPATDLALALKKTRDQVREKIFRNMSQRAGEHLREEMELLGPQRVSVVEEAQQRVVASIRRLEEEGRLTIARAGEEEIVE
jgi:flagellar motor switch protein FliG